MESGWGQAGPQWHICSHGIDRQQQRCGACDGYPFGPNQSLVSAGGNHLEAKLDAIYAKLSEIEKLLKARV